VGGKVGGATGYTGGAARRDLLTAAPGSPSAVPWPPEPSRVTVTLTVVVVVVVVNTPNL
jgi:hypothetical protein